VGKTQAGACRVHHFIEAAQKHWQVAVMNSIQVSAKFANIPTANLTEFKKVAAAALAITKSEPGVLQYDWFFDDTETVCVVLERYQDSEALLTHVANVGEAFGRLVELVGACELEMFGEPSARLLDTPAGVQRSVFRSYFQGK
jgi:quinol monooxygenase YgiN